MIKATLITLLSPLSMVYGRAMKLRNNLYDNETFEVQKLAVPVVSVGNITAGGTGKTPFVLGLLDWAAEQDLKAGVISRGYKSASSQPRRVDIEAADAPHLFGDEPTLIAKKRTNVPVYVGVNRADVGRKMIEENPVQLIFADDAFQHRRLHRDINVALVDALGELKKEKMLPAGRLREPYEGLKRADFVVITRANLVSEAKLQSLKKEVQELGFKSEQIIEDSLEIESCYQVRYPDQERIESGVDRIPQPALLISGIGQPKSFELLLEKNQIRFKKHYHFPDHHAFTDQDIEAIASSKEAQSAKCILTTEKDLVKLSELELTPEDLKNLPVYVLAVKSSYSENMRKLRDAIIGLVR